MIGQHPAPRPAHRGRDGGRPRIGPHALFESTHRARPTGPATPTPRGICQNYPHPHAPFAASQRRPAALCLETSPRVASHPSPSLGSVASRQPVRPPLVYAAGVPASASTEAEGTNPSRRPTAMAATADPRTKQPPPAAPHHLTKAWAPPPRAHHRVPSLTVVSGGGARDQRRSSSSSSHRRGAADEAAKEEEEARNGRVEDPRARLVGHLRDKPPPLKHRVRTPAREPEAQTAPLPQLPTLHQHDAPATRPWNLRDRKRRPSARAAAAAAAASSPATSPWEESASSDVRAPFAVALTAEEVEEDIYALTGARPRWRPRKRPRVVQRQLDTLFPGLWLTEITADAYKVPDE